jgi:UDP:flavonoid glycosyltransferase YjiC (YdhE family)
VGQPSQIGPEPAVPRPPTYRVLFTTLPFFSHFLAQLPLARAVQNAGHDVQFATFDELADLVASAGFATLSMGLASSVEAEGGGVAFRSDRPFPYMHLAARITTSLQHAFEQWLPDAVIRDPLEFGSCVAAEAAGVPHVVGREGPFWSPDVRRSVLGDDLCDLRAHVGLSADPATEMPYRYLSFAFAPPELLGPDAYVPPVMHFIRPGQVESVVADDEHEWVAPAAGRPLVYATLGTVFNRGHRQVLHDVARAIIGERYDVLLTTGPGLDPDRFSWTVNIRNLTVRQFVPQSDVLPYCDVMVAHGGFNTVVGALAYGVPMLLLPIKGDQPRNARWCSDAGAALVLDTSGRDIESIKLGVRRVLEDAELQLAAEAMQAAIAALPGISRAVRLVEELAVQKQPILREESVIAG